MPVAQRFKRKGSIYGQHNVANISGSTSCALWLSSPETTENNGNVALFLNFYQTSNVCIPMEGRAHSTSHPTQSCAFPKASLTWREGTSCTLQAVGFCFPLQFQASFKRFQWYSLSIFISLIVENMLLREGRGVAHLCAHLGGLNWVMSWHQAVYCRVRNSSLPKSYVEQYISK